MSDEFTSTVLTVNNRQHSGSETVNEWPQKVRLLFFYEWK